MSMLATILNYLKQCIMDVCGLITKLGITRLSLVGKYAGMKLFYTVVVKGAIYSY